MVSIMQKRGCRKNAFFVAAANSPTVKLVLRTTHELAEK
jgi:hypothetical protein